MDKLFPSLSKLLKRTHAAAPGTALAAKGKPAAGGALSGGAAVLARMRAAQAAKAGAPAAGGAGGAGGNKVEIKPLVLYGSQTGNSAEIAKQFAAEASSHGIKNCKVMAMEETDLSILKEGKANPWMLCT